MKLKYFLIIFLLLILLACGGSSGSSDIEVVSPEQEQRFFAGDAIDFSLATSNFNLAPPFNLRNGHIHAKNHPPADEAHDHDSEHEHEDQHEHMAEHEHEDQHEHAPDDGHAGHDHQIQETNSNAKEGHYHVYLDHAAGSDPHLTSWSYTDSFQLPDHISTGMHTLRFELRDNHHTIVGPETILFFEVIEK